jgi:hypothetical protein
MDLVSQVKLLTPDGDFGHVRLSRPPNSDPKKEMQMNHRFSIKQDGLIVDALNPANNCDRNYFFDGDPKDDAHLRERVLWIRLADLVEHLIINTNPMERFPDGQGYQPHCEESGSISWALYNAIMASHLNTLDVVLSIQHKFGGELKREKTGWQDFTSLSLFVDDVERLLRDLYGEADDKAVDRVRQAVSWIVEEFVKHLRKDLWQEHQNAVNIDYMCGIGVPKGYGLSSSDHRRGHCAAHDVELLVRVDAAAGVALRRLVGPLGYANNLPGSVHDVC